MDRSRIGLLRWWRDLWSFGALSFSLMSHDLHYFLILEECGSGDSVVKSLTSKTAANSETWGHFNNGVGCNLV